MNSANALRGALVADAATMGLHWMYDQDLLVQLEKSGDLLFRQPDFNIYQDKKAYFAHAAKRSGEYSQYGQCARVVADLLDKQDQYSTANHRAIFFDTFGPCGSYHGFADRPTKALIARIILDGDDISDLSGSDDDQLPALCSVPALFYHEADHPTVRAAVSVTTINETAISGALVLHHCLNLLKSEVSLEDALMQSIDSANSELASSLKEALNREPYDPLAAANHFGMPCHMTQGLPLAWYLLKHSTDYETVVRDNIRCGGDSCGRAMAVGSVAGLLYGVPDEMKRRVRDRV